MAAVGKAILVIAAGLFLMWWGVRSMSGYETTTEHLYGGKFEEITCDGGEPIAGKGLLTPSAEIACDQAQDDQRGRAPWWIGGGLIVTALGVTMFRRARGQ